MCFIFKSCVDFLVSAAEAEAHETLQGSLMWQGAGKFSGLAGPFVGSAVGRNITPNHNTIASARQCILLILLSVKSDSIMLWWFKKWNETRCSEKNDWHLNLGTVVQHSRWWLSRTGCWRKYHHVSFVDNICSCVLFPRLWARISRT